MIIIGKATFILLPIVISLFMSGISVFAQGYNCTDSDGQQINPLVKGVCTDINGSEYSEYCIDDYNVMEYYCTGGANPYCNVWPTNCQGYGSDYKCLNGSCVFVNNNNTCIDFDNGIDFETASYITSNNKVFFDFCYNTSWGKQKVREYYCKNNKMVNTVSPDCICQNGKCINITVPSFCIDPDGYNHQTSSYCQDKTGIYYDGCAWGGANAVDWICTNSTGICYSGQKGCDHWYGTGWRCENGACVPPDNSSFNESQLVLGIENNTNESFEFSPNSDVDSIDFSANAPINDFIIVSVLTNESKPVLLPNVSNASNFSAHSYVHISVSENLKANVKNVNITFKVDKSWLSSEGFSSNEIVIYRYNNTTGIWDLKDSSMSGQDSSYVYYSMITNNFSDITVGVPPSSSSVTGMQSAPGLEFGLAAMLASVLITIGLLGLSVKKP